MVSFKGISVDEILNSSGSSHNNLNSTFLQSFGVLSKFSASDQTSALDFQEFTEAEHGPVVLKGEFSSGGDDQSLTFWGVVVDNLEGSDGEGGSFSGSRLGLSDDVVFLDNGKDSFLLDDGGFLEAESWIEGGIP